MNTKEFEKKYYVNRKGALSIKWNRGEKEKCLPVWVADMDFKVEDKVIEKLHGVIEQGAYGYSTLPIDYYERMIEFNKKRHHITYKKEWINFSSGAVCGINECVRLFTKEKDAIMINPPVYGPFKSTILDCKRKCVESKLVNNDGYYTFDFDDIEKKIIKNKVKMIILCSPANPAGRVWKQGELEELFEITHRHHVLVLSDEVHADIIRKDQEFIPSLTFKKYQNEIITLNAVSKTFNLAMFNHCHVIIPDIKKRTIYENWMKLTHRSMPNVMNALPTYYSYIYGEKWLDSVLDVIYENYDYLCSRLNGYANITALEGTYLAFVDLSKVCGKKKAIEFMMEDCHILPNAGDDYGKGYDKYVRINLATTRANIKKVCDSIITNAII